VTESNRDPKNIFSTVVIVMVGQIGCLTLVIVLAALFAGLWLDHTFNTKPLFTLILMLAGIPLSVVLMLTLARKSIAKLEAGKSKTRKEDSA